MLQGMMHQARKTYATKGFELDMQVCYLNCTENQGEMGKVHDIRVDH